MMNHEFYHWYANLPFHLRGEILNMNELGMMTASDVYKVMKELDDKIRPDIIRQEKMLRVIDDLRIQKKLP